MKTRSINNLFDVLTGGLIDRNSQARHAVIKAWDAFKAEVIAYLPALTPDERELIASGANGSKFTVITGYRTRVGCDLGEAKAKVDVFADEMKGGTYYTFDVSETGKE